MSDTYTEIYYHLVWATKKREAMITPEIQALLYRSIQAACHELHVTIHALNSLPDHVHLACTLPTTVPLSDMMHKIKGGSAHLINHLPGGHYSIAWQPGYGALTFAQRNLKQIVGYIENQQKHHEQSTLSEKMEIIATEWTRC